MWSLKSRETDSRSSSDGHAGRQMADTRADSREENSSLTNCWCDTSVFSPANTSDTGTPQEQHAHLFLFNLDPRVD